MRCTLVPVLAVLLGAVGTQAVWCPATMGTAWSCTLNCDCSPNAFRNTCDTNTGKCVAGPVNPPFPDCVLGGVLRCSTAGGTVTQQCKCVATNAICVPDDSQDAAYNTCVLKCAFGGNCNSNCFCASPYACDAGVCTLPKCATNPALQCGTTAGKCSCATSETCVYDSVLRKNVCKTTCALNAECTAGCVCASPNTCKAVAGTTKTYCKLPTCNLSNAGYQCGSTAGYCSCPTGKVCDEGVDRKCKTGCAIGGGCGVYDCACPAPNTCPGNICTQPDCGTAPSTPSCGTVIGTCKCTDQGTCVNGVCLPPCTAQQACDTSTATCVCTSPNTCSNNKCLPPCNPNGGCGLVTSTCFCGAPNGCSVTNKCLPGCAITSPFQSCNLPTSTCACVPPNICQGNKCKPPCAVGDLCDNPSATCACPSLCKNNQCTVSCPDDGSFEGKCTNTGNAGSCTCPTNFTCKANGNTCVAVPPCSQNAKCGSCGCELPRVCIGPIPGDQFCKLPNCQGGESCSTCNCVSPLSCRSGFCKKPACGSNNKCTQSCDCDPPYSCQGQTGDLRCKLST